MFEKILFPTDFSDVAARALETVKQLKAVGSKEVVLLHVVDRREMFALDRYLVMETSLTVKERADFELKATAYAQGKMKAIEEDLVKAGFKVKSIIVEGTPFVEILRVEEEEGVTDVVIGSHGISNIAEMFLGSVSEKVIRKSKKPVYVVKRD